jgi:hypothetical protein
MIHATYMNKRFKKNAKIRFHSKRPHTITKMNDNINMDITIARSTISDFCKISNFRITIRIFGEFLENSSIVKVLFPVC